ncbi:MAG: CapA family protein, partial [archaeon]
LLFETETTQGPKELCTKTFIEQSKKYKNYEKVLLIHWGEENINYPLRSQRVKAKELINAGADLIIGTHPHVIQGYEQYKNKYIFYSLGNFFFPDTNNKTGKIKRTKTNKTSIIPIFNNKLKLEKILTVYHENNNKITLIKNNNKVKKLSKKLHFKYYQILIVYELIKRDVIKPIIKKVIK